MVLSSHFISVTLQAQETQILFLGPKFPHLCFNVHVLRECAHKFPQILRRIQTTSCEESPMVSKSCLQHSHWLISDSPWVWPSAGNGSGGLDLTRGKISKLLPVISVEIQVGNPFSLTIYLPATPWNLFWKTKLNIFKSVVSGEADCYIDAMTHLQVLEK